VVTSPFPWWTISKEAKPISTTIMCLHRSAIFWYMQVSYLVRSWMTM
jgi:hypothetical protein